LRGAAGDSSGGGDAFMGSALLRGKVQREQRPVIVLAVAGWLHLCVHHISANRM